MSNVGIIIKIPIYWPKSMNNWQIKNIFASKFSSCSILHKKYLIKVLLKMRRWGNLTSSFFYKEIPNVGTSLKIPTYWPKSMSTCQIKHMLVSKFSSRSILHKQHFIKLFLKMIRWDNHTFRFFNKEIWNIGSREQF